jgi:hypothetical protein
MPGVEHRQHRGLKPRGEFSSADPTTRAYHEALQIGPASAAFSLGPRPGRKPLPPSCEHQRRPSSKVAPMLPMLDTGQREQAFVTWAEVTGIAAAC